MLSVLVMVSGGGTNLQSILDSVASGRIADTKIVGVISNNYGVYALERAKKSGVPGMVVSPKDFPDRAAFEQALCRAVDSFSPDLVVLAGYLVKIPPEMVKAYRRRIINIHPSLIPAFCGVGFYGLRVHEAALARGVKVTGATVHFVDEGTDSGPILCQKAVYVEKGDTPESLQRRVMEQAEWQILPQVIDQIARGEIPLGE